VHARREPLTLGAQEINYENNHSPQIPEEFGRGQRGRELPCSVMGVDHGPTTPSEWRSSGSMDREEVISMASARSKACASSPCAMSIATFLAREAKKLGDASKPVETYTDVRKLLASREIDAISTATPNHWHALVSFWACQAGKDVYVEKPVSHNVWEGRKIVEAARKYNRIVQTGTQSRSSAALREGLAWVQQGNLGKISRGLCYKTEAEHRQSDAPQPVPASIDYDLWCCPAPKGPLMRTRLQ
jgi:hypothetical protein